MTAIVGLVCDGTVYLGGDSAASYDCRLDLIASSKVARRGDYVIGASGSGRVAQLATYAFDPPSPSGDLTRFMVTGFVDALRDCLADGGCATKAWSLLVGVAGRLYRVHDDYHVNEVREGYNAIGSGAAIAMGALYATAGTALGPDERVLLALEAAEEHITNVRRPFTVLELPPTPTGGNA